MRVCRFCLQEVPYKPLKEMDENDIDVHFCYTCNAEYLYWKLFGENENEWVSWSLYVTIGDKMYRWTYSSAETAQLWYVKEPGEPGTRANHKLDLLYYCGFKNALESTPIPDINPQNAVEKIKLLIMFS